MALLPPPGFADGYLDHAQLCGLKLCGLGEWFGNDSNSKRVRPGRAAPIILVSRQHNRVIVRPGDELPWAAPGGLLVELSRGWSGYDGHDRHSQQLGKNVERLLQGQP